MATNEGSYMQGFLTVNRDALKNPDLYDSTSACPTVLQPRYTHVCRVIQRGPWETIPSLSISPTRY